MARWWGGRRVAGRSARRCRETQQAFSVVWDKSWIHDLQTYRMSYWDQSIDSVSLRKPNTLHNGEKTPIKHPLYHPITTLEVSMNYSVSDSCKKEKKTVSCVTWNRLISHRCKVPRPRPPVWDPGGGVWDWKGQGGRASAWGIKQWQPPCATSRTAREPRSFLSHPRTQAVLSSPPKGISS